MGLAHGGDVAFRIPDTPPVDAGCAPLGCDVVAILTHPTVVTALLFISLLVVATVGYIKDAERACRRERRRVVDEHDAFEEFADRIAALDPCPPDPTVPATPSPVGADEQTRAGATGDVRLWQVLDAYRETVVSLPHYGDEYDETIAESLAAELGPDIAVSLASNGTLSAGLQSALVDRSRQAAEARRALIDAIDAEIEAVETAGAALSRIDRERDALVGHMGETTDVGAAIDVWGRLDALERDCDRLAADRQDQLDAGTAYQKPRTIASDVPFHEYLYGHTSTPTHPVLASVATLAERVRTERARIGERIADPR